MVQSINYIKNSKFGYYYNSAALTKKIISISKRIYNSEGFEQISYLFNLLNTLSKENNYEYLTTINSNNNNTSKVSIAKAIDYLYDHFCESFTLNDVAMIANLNSSALCRAFKRRTGYTIFEFSNRLRIEKACHLLKENKLSISEIAYEVGYNTFSHFSTLFQRIMNITPSGYKEKINILK